MCEESGMYGVTLILLNCSLSPSTQVTAVKTPEKEKLVIEIFVTNTDRKG